MGKFYSGFVSLIGRPNVGKSTLMNCLIGEKIAITSNKPQTTRNKITSILTKDDFQCVFLDTPGIHKPKHKLGEFMVRSAENTFKEVDLVLFLVEPTDKVLEADQYVLEKLGNVKTPVVLVINKIDTVPDKEKLLAIIDAYRKLYPFKEVVPISAATGSNTETLLSVIRKFLPEGPQYFPAEMVTDQPERQIASEIIREKALYLLQDEIPHGIAVEIMSMKKRPDQNMVDVQALIYCEKDSHKGIIIGKGGQEVDKLKEELKKVTDKDIQINIFEVKRPELDAVIVANNIARQVEGKIAYRRAIKMAIANTMRMGAEGIKIQISGRLNGAEMARSEMYKEGRTPLHTFRADIDYCHAEALTKVGLLGIKVWICRGEVYGKKELAPNFTQSKESGRGSNSGNNGGKNFKRKKNNR